MQLASSWAVPRRSSSLQLFGHRDADVFCVARFHPFWCEACALQYAPHYAGKDMCDIHKRTTIQLKKNNLTIQQVAQHSAATDWKTATTGEFAHIVGQPTVYSETRSWAVDTFVWSAHKQGPHIAYIQKYSADCDCVSVLQSEWVRIVKSAEACLWLCDCLRACNRFSQNPNG